MDPRRGDDYKRFRNEVERFFADQLTPEMLEQVRATGNAYDPTLHKAIADRGWIGATWPTEFGGSNLSPAEAGAFWEVAARRQAPVGAQLLTELAASAILKTGTSQQRERLIPPVLAGETLIALGYSEADAGSDVAATRTKAVRTDDSWVIDGAKMFTTFADIADYVFLLTRTDPDVAKHRGLTMFLVPLDAEGIEVQPIETFGGERTNATFYRNVVVPDSARIGDINGGWAVLNAALDAERAAIGGHVGEAERTLAELVDALRAVPGNLLAQSDIRARLAGWTARIEESRVLSDRVAWLIGAGRPAPVEAAMTKLAVTETLKDLVFEALQLVGPPALMAGRLEESFRHAQITTIYGGTNEIQRNIIAQRGLGLPRS